MNIICDCNMNSIDLIANLSKTMFLKNTIREANSGLRKRAMKIGIKAVQVNPVNSIREARFLYFFYNYLKYLKIDYHNMNQEVRKGQNVSIWAESLALIKNFSESISLTTSFWVIEILILLSTKFNASVDKRDLGSDGRPEQRGSQDLRR